MSIVEYMNKFEELKIRCRGVEDLRQTLARFKLGLRVDIRSQMITQQTYTVDEAFQLVLKLGKHLKQPLTRRFPSQAEKTPLRKTNLWAPTMQPNYKSEYCYW